MKEFLTYAAVAFLALFAASASNGQTYSVVYNFGSQVGDPIFHYSSGIIAQGRDGNLYSSSWGGASDNGAAFMVSPSGELTNLYNFTNGTDSALPYAGLTLGTDGNFYGNAYSANLNNGPAPYGTVFRMSPSGTLDTLYTFKDGSDGAFPIAPPIQAVDGNFYGTTCGYSCAGVRGSYGSITGSLRPGNLLYSTLAVPIVLISKPRSFKAKTEPSTVPQVPVEPMTMVRSSKLLRMGNFLFSITSTVSTAMDRKVLWFKPVTGTSTAPHSSVVVVVTPAESFTALLRRVSSPWFTL